MSLVIELAPEEEAKIAEEAQSIGISVADFARQRLLKMPVDAEETKRLRAIATLRQWREESRSNWNAMSEEERKKAQEDWEDNMRDLDEWRFGRKLYPELARKEEAE